MKINNLKYGKIYKFKYLLFIDELKNHYEYFIFKYDKEDKYYIYTLNGAIWADINTNEILDIIYWKTYFPKCDIDEESLEEITDEKLIKIYKDILE